MTSIHLVLLEDQNPQITWPFGQISRTTTRIADLNHLVNKEANQDAQEFWLFWGNQAEIPSTQLLESLTAQPVDIWHAGLLMGTAGLPKLIDFVSPTWMLNRDPEPIIEATSDRKSVV